MKSLVVKVVLPIILIFLFTYASAQQNQSESRDAEFYCNRGNAYLDKGQHQRAILDYTRALEINPRMLMLTLIRVMPMRKGHRGWHR
jgi:tetratricopeptide (TPR) repeat protein